MTQATAILFPALALTGLLVCAGPALACSPALFAAGTADRDGTCGLTYYDDEVTARAISEAEDLGGGQVAQYFFTGNACYGNVSMIVLDCTGGQAAVFGPGPTEGAGPGLVEGGTFKGLDNRLRGAAQSGAPLPVASIAAEAQGQFANAALVAIPALVGISNDTSAPLHSFDLGCGCRLYYPGSAGAGQ